MRAVNGWFSRLIPAGFYYKTFMASQAAWHFFERHIRASSGLGESPADGVYDRGEMLAQQHVDRLLEQLQR